MAYLGLIFLGAGLCCLGAINLKGEVRTIHPYHRQRVTQEELPAYARAMGLGTLVTGLSITGCAIAQMIHETDLAWIIMLAGIGAGVFCMIAAQIRYNHGIF